MDLQAIAALWDDLLIRRAVIAVVGITMIFALRRIVRKALVARVRDNAARYRTRKLTDLLAYFLFAVFLLVLFTDELGGVTVAFGVAGAGIAFALQEVIGSVAGWLAIIFAGFYKVGDRVMLGGIRGDVIDIGVLRTTLFEIGAWVDGDVYNGRVVRLANSFVFKEPVFNYSADFPFLWDEITVPVRHGSDRALAREILAEVAESVVGDYTREIAATWEDMTRRYMIEPARVEPLVTMVMDQNWMTFTLRYVVAFDRRRLTRDALFSQVLDRFEQTDGKVRVATAAQEVTLVDGRETSADPPRPARTAL